TAPSLVAFLRSPNDANKAAALAELTRLSARSPQSLGAELRDAAGRRVLGTTGFSPNGALLVPSAGREAEISALRWTGTSVWIDVAARVHAGPTDTLGTLVQYSSLGTAQSQKALEDLIGPTAVFLLGNQDNSMWTNIERPVAGPHFDPRGRTALIRDTVGGGRIGAIMRMRAAPWVVWVGLPMASVLAPVHILLGKLVVTAANILLIGAGVAWVASRRVTKPLGELTQASEGIAAGDYSRRVPVLHDNELGRLAASFNSMAAQIEDGRRDLEQRVAERTTELRGALERLNLAQQEVVRSEKLAFLGQLAGGVGHELRNPLGVMTNAVHYLGLVLENAPATVVEYLGILRTQIGLAERIAIHPGITVDVDVPADVPPLYVDRIQLGQVLLNLISNGTQAIGESKGTLTLRARANGDRMATLEVQDTGSGIGPENLPHIFEPLFTTKARGLGLGLSVARSLVVVNGGELAVESEKGRGSTFTVRVPIVGAHP